MHASQQEASITTTVMLGKQSNKALYQCVELAFGDMELRLVEHFAEMREVLETLLVCTTYCLYLVLQSVFPINAANARSYPG